MANPIRAALAEDGNVTTKVTVSATQVSLAITGQWRQAGPLALNGHFRLCERAPALAAAPLTAAPDGRQHSS